MSISAEAKPLPRAEENPARARPFLFLSEEVKPWGCLCCQPEARGLLPGAAELSASWLSGDEGEAGPELSLKSRMLGSLLCCQAGTIPHTLFPTGH